MIITGFYRWSRRRTAFRNDYCMSCDQQVRADCIRAFVVLHVKRIPLVPLGFWRQWECSQCGRRPSCPRTARTSILTLGAIVFGLFGILLFWVALTFDKVKTAAILAIGTGFCVASAGLSFWCWKRSFAPSYNDRFAAVSRSESMTCPECGAGLTVNPASDTLECESCGIQRI